MPLCASQIRPGQAKALLLLSLLANLALAAGTAYLVLRPKASDPAERRTGTGEGSDKEVNALGRIQPSGGLISVFGLPGDRITELAVKVGDPVEPGQRLGHLSGESERALSLETLRAQIREAESLRKAIEASREAKLADLEAEAKQATAGIEQDAKALDAKVEAVEAQNTRANNELNRLNETKAAGVNVSAQEFEQVKALLATAKAEKAVALASKEKLFIQKEQSGVSIKAKQAALRAETERGLAQVPYESLQAGLRLAERKVKDGELVAPMAGRVVRVLGKAGDTVTTQPLIQIADTKTMTVIAEVYETDVGRIRGWLKAGPVKVEATARALGDTTGKPTVLTGTVTATDKIAPLIAKNALTPLGPREDADRRVVEVEVELDGAAVDAAQNFIGLQVIAKFRAK